MPDESWGEAVTAVVSTRAKRDAAGLTALVKEHLAGYKAPKQVMFADEVYRSPSGKADPTRTKEVAFSALRGG